MLNAQDEKEDCPFQHKSEKTRSAREAEKYSDTEPKTDSDSETEEPCHQKRSAGETEECLDTEPERDSDSATGEPSNNVDWEDVEIEYEDGEKPIIIKEDEALVFGAIMLQLSLKQGLREWGDRAEKSATKEMKQLHDMSSFFPRYAKTLTKE